MLVDLEEADIVAAGERSAPRGTLTLTAPIDHRRRLLRPILDAFMNEYQAVSARLYLLDRPVNLIDEGIDVALASRTSPIRISSRSASAKFAA